MINDVERCHSGDCHQGNTDDPSCELHHFLTQPTRSDPFSSRSANWEDNMGDDSDANWQFRSEGTVVHQNEKRIGSRTTALQERKYLPFTQSHWWRLLLVAS